MTHQPPPRLLYLRLAALLLTLPLAGCNLLGQVGFSGADEPPMSVEEALETSPFDSRPTVLEEMGPPDAFTIQFKELEGQIVRWESWSYFDFTTQFDFIDGELLWTIDIEPVPEGSFYAHFYDPLALQEGMSQAEVEALFPQIGFLEIPLDAIELEGGIALAGEQILLGFYQDELVYVETVILSPAADGQPLAGLSPQPAQVEPTLEPTQQPTQEPTLAPSPEPTTPQLARFEDGFEGETALAIPLFGQSVMEYGVIDGEGALTSHFPGGVLLAYYQEPELLDFILEVELRPLDFVAGSNAGILFRSEYPAGGADYYQMVSVLPNEGQIEMRTWLGGEWAQVEAQDIPADLIPPFGVYRLRVDCQGDQIAVYLGDGLAASFTTSLILDPGYFGLTLISARDPETVTYDNLVISEHP